MKIDQLKQMAIQHQLIGYSSEQSEDDYDFIVLAFSKFSKLVAVAEAAKKLVKNTPTEPTGFVHIPPANFFFDLQNKLESLEQK